MPSFTVFKGSKDGSIIKSETSKPDLTGDQVFVKVTAAGLCGTDLHYRQADMVLSHEGVGVVQETGPGAKYLKKGDRVGWGYVHDTCSHCDKCLSGRDTYCKERKMYGEADTDQGGFASGAVWREAFLFKIPDLLSDEEAAPLNCAGATVFNCLHAYDVQPTEAVGIMGIGGLGHLAIQFAAKMGCHVTVLSSSEAKRDEAMKLGASEYVATKGVKELKVSRPLDRLIVTTSAQPDWAQLLPILNMNATIHPVSVAEGDFSIPYMPMLVSGITVQGSVVAPRYIHQRMFQFSAEHGIKPMTQRYSMTEKGITEAMAALEKGEVRYRAVLIPQ